MVDIIITTSLCVAFGVLGFICWDTFKREREEDDWGDKD